MNNLEVDLGLCSSIYDGTVVKLMTLYSSLSSLVCSNPTESDIKKYTFPSEFFSIFGITIVQIVHKVENFQR
uniref:Uncharacterized protein n=1 Tax=Romanomermis culicivorax TaxID=13658 RepID=A0A915IFE5_ROMCU